MDSGFLRSGKDSAVLLQSELCRNVVTNVYLASVT